MDCQGNDDTFNVTTDVPADPAQRLRSAIDARWGRLNARGPGETGALSQLARALRRAAEDVALSAACREVKSFVSSRPSVERALAYAYGTRVRTFDTRITPNQIPSEIEALLGRLEALRPRTILEIGTSFGGTLFLLATVAADDALLLTVDLPDSGHGQSYSKRRAKLYRAFARRSQRIELLRMDSHEDGTLERVKALLGESRIDFLFIDGDHTYEGVRDDYDMYTPLVREGGLIGLHDIVPGASEFVGGVPRFWQELKTQVDVDEIVEDWGHGGFGIGLVTRAATALGT